MSRAAAMAEALEAIRAEMVASLAERLAEIAAALSGPIDPSRAHVARRMLHRLRGSAGSVGLSEIAKLAGQMELRLEAFDATVPVDLRTELEDLRAAVARVVGP